MPVSVFRGRRRPGKKWTSTDRLLMLALQAYEDDCCPGCGQPRTYSFDPDARGRYKAPHATCEGCASLTRADKALGEKKPPGLVVYLQPDDALEYAMHHPIHVPPFPQ